MCQRIRVVRRPKADAEQQQQLSARVTGTKYGYATASQTSDPVTVAPGNIGAARPPGNP